MRPALDSTLSAMDPPKHVAGPSARAWWNQEMDVSALLIELYDRIPSLARQAVDGLDPQQLTERPATQTNSIGWLIWHMTRVQDHHLAEILETDQVWTDGDWAAR